MRRGEPGPLVLGGDEDSSRRLLAAVPPMVREAVAGRFTADSRTLTAARVRDLASPVIAGVRSCGPGSTAAAILAMPPGGRSAVGLHAARPRSAPGPRRPWSFRATAWSPGTNAAGAAR